MNLDPTIVRREIEALRLSFPELFEDGDEQLLHDMLQGQTSLHEFLGIVEDRRQDAASMAGAIATRIGELELRQRRIEKREQAMRRLAFQLMQAAEQKKIELPTATLSIRYSTPRVMIIDEGAVPDDFCRFKREPDKTRIKEALQNTTFVPGATLSNVEPTLAIRTR